MSSLLFLIVWAASFTSHGATQVPGNYIWSVCDNCYEPESAYYDEQSKSIFISNVVGKPDEKDGKGWIQKVDVSGKMRHSKWVSGFHAPKGMRSHKGLLWVSDIDEVVAIDIKSSKIRKKIPIEGAKFLNDVAITKDGTVFVSDTIGSKIYKLSGDKSEVFVEGSELEGPNGLLILGNELVVASWGTPAADWSTKVPGKLYSLNLETKKKTIITEQPVGNLDGLEKFGDDFLVSDWIAGKVFQITAKGKVTELYYGMKGAADIGFIPKTKTLIIPRMGDNTITAYRLSEK